MDNDRELVHDAWLEVMNDPEKYSDFHIQLVEDLEYKFKNEGIKSLTNKQRFYIEKILNDDT